jgi:hypothetical protein
LFTRHIPATSIPAHAFGLSLIIPDRRLECRKAYDGFKQLQIKNAGLHQVVKVSAPSMDRAHWPDLSI